MKIKNVVSVFDGMSCGNIALDELGITYDNYYASEIDTYAMSVAKDNYPNIKHVGDVTKLNGHDFKDVDLFLGGSPCQSFSQAGDGSGFDGSSKLFWEFVRLLKEIKPKYFFLENVMMKKEWEKVITDTLQVEPIEITTLKFLPQNRRRLYWTNIPGVKQPEQVNWDINDYIQGDGFPTYCTKGRFFKRKDYFNTLTTSYYKGIRGASRPAISIRESFLDDDRDAHRMLTPEECEAIQGVPIGYTKCVSKTQRYKMLGNGWSIPPVKHILKNIGDDPIKLGIKTNVGISSIF